MVQIISDSTCDLTKELAQRYGIDILPLHILLGDEEYDDGTLTPNEIFQWSDAHKTTPKTSAPSLDRTLDLFRAHLDAGKEIVFFAISSDISASYSVAKLAAETLDAADRISVIDTRHLSTGIAQLAVEGAVMAAEGKSRTEIVAEIEKLIPRVSTSFVVDTLVYLHRGGRCSGLTALAGGVLGLHPKIIMEDGKLHPGKKYRGKISKVIPAYVQDMEAELRAAKPDRIFITHTCQDRADFEAVRTYLESLNVFSEILECPAGGVISSHCGPGTLGVLFIGAET